MSIYPSFKKSDCSKSTPKREERRTKQLRRESNISKTSQRSKIFWKRTINTILQIFARIVQHTSSEVSYRIRLHVRGLCVYCWSQLLFTIFTNELARISSFAGFPQWFGASSRERRKRLRRRSARPRGIFQPHLTILLSLKTCYIIFFSL